MKNKLTTRTRRTKMKLTPDEHDFSRVDTWAQKLRLEDGQPLSASQRREEGLARGVGRPAKPDSAKARRVMISMSPSLIKAAGVYAKRTGHTLSGLIAQSLVEKIKRKAS